MRGLLICGVIMGLLGGVAVRAEDAAAPAPRLPRLVVTPERYEAGELWQGQTASFEVELGNEGTADLDFEVRSGCGCAVVAPDRKQLRPGERLKVPVRFDTTTRMPGDNRVTLTVESSDPERPTATVAIVAHVKRLYEMDPPQGLSLRTFERGGRPVVTARLKALGEEALKLAVEEVAPPVFDVAIKPVEAGREYEIRAVLREALTEAGARSAVLRLTTGLKAVPELRLPVQVVVSDRVTYMPRALLVSARSAGRPQSIRVAFFGSTEHRITGVKSDNPRVVARVSTEGEQAPPLRVGGIATSRMERVVVEFPAQSEIGAGGAWIEIETSDPEFPRLRVRVTTEMQEYRRIMMAGLTGEAAAADRPATAAPGAAPAESENQ